MLIAVSESITVTLLSVMSVWAELSCWCSQLHTDIMHGCFMTDKYSTHRVIERFVAVFSFSVSMSVNVACWLVSRKKTRKTYYYRLMNTEVRLSLGLSVLVSVCLPLCDSSSGVTWPVCLYICVYVCLGDSGVTWPTLQYSQLSLYQYIKLGQLET